VNGPRAYRDRVPTPAEIMSFDEGTPPPGATPWVGGAGPSRAVTVVDPDPVWPAHYAELEARLRAALGARVLTVDHIGSTSVPGLAAKPVIDIDLVVADTTDEDAFVPALEEVGFALHAREPWWGGHRLLRATAPACHLHVFPPEHAAPWRDRIFRDHLRRTPGDVELYARAKWEASAAATAAGEDGMQYNRRKQDVIRAIHHRAFVAAGLLAG
jgi:GrpB-like predicted nucleotidyltransferase (UPF0157 family)